MNKYEYCAISVEVTVTFVCSCLPQVPMDLGTVLKKVQADAYGSAAEAWEDVLLVWQNCRRFNEPACEVYKACEELAGFVHQTWLQARLPSPPPVRF